MSTPSAQRPTPSGAVTGSVRASQRRVLRTTCQKHGAAGFTNLLVTKEGGFIVLNPHVGNCCVLRLDEQVATVLYHLLGEWLGHETTPDPGRAAGARRSRRCAPPPIDSSHSTQ